MRKSEKLELFLSLKSFDEYMDRFDDLVGLPSGADTFRKEMQLMVLYWDYTEPLTKEFFLENIKSRI